MVLVLATKMARAPWIRGLQGQPCVCARRVHSETVRDDGPLRARRTTQMVNGKRAIKTERFLDYKVIKVNSGRGGDGAVHFFATSRKSHLTGLPMGKPCGGNGGDGGDIILIGDSRVTTLGGLSSLYRAASGGVGGTQDMHGATGSTVEIRVPLGTVIRWKRPITHERDEISAECVDISKMKDLGSGRIRRRELVRKIIADRKREAAALSSEEVDDGTAEEDPRMEILRQYYILKDDHVPPPEHIKFLLSRVREPTPVDPINMPVIDIKADGERHVVARGGAGGFGNPTFALGAAGLGAMVASRGSRGETHVLELELKTIADAGLLGLPNAGKSSFLAALSSAKPRIAPYPFTTLNPYVGTLEYPDFATVTLADIPGIVEGAHRDVGLGHTFLRHVERADVLVYVVDIAGPSPWRDLEILRNELDSYVEGLGAKPSVIIANKADLPTAKDNFDRLREWFTTQSEEFRHTPIVPVSAKYRKNIPLAMDTIRSVIDRHRASVNHVNR
ncbi:P-loop containing nucleoside triphosphate hydrolase protein [Cladochytrium replicatum]|nr:P-loop containing nucleoside triphosphate hydrolase protein [Cladochytrium replicatum]